MASRWIPAWVVLAGRGEGFYRRLNMSFRPAIVDADVRSPLEFSRARAFLLTAVLLDRKIIQHVGRIITPKQVEAIFAGA
jgi:hypothetical protein